MRRLVLASAISLSLLPLGARAQDNPNDGREQAYERRARELEQRQRAMDERALRDDQRDLARILALEGRLKTLRAERAPKWAVVAFDADVQRELASERLEGQAELRQDGEAGRRGPDGRRERAEDARQREEGAQGRRLEQIRQEWANQNGQYGRGGMERRQSLMTELVALARRELASDRKDVRESRLDDRR
jgi:hypothetical protein